MSKEHITKTPGVCGGKACIAGTRISVAIIVSRVQSGESPEQVALIYRDSMTLADVYAALTYYHDHPEEIEAAFQKGRELEDWARAQPSLLRERLAANPELRKSLDEPAR